MSYPRNEVAPKKILVGDMLAVADGALLAATTGVVVKVTLDGGAAGDGGGTLTYDNGFVYAPLQAETDGDIFTVRISKTGYTCASANVTTDPVKPAVSLAWADTSGTVPVPSGMATATNVSTAVSDLETWGSTRWLTATGFATPTNITAAAGITLAASQHVIVDSGTVTASNMVAAAPTAQNIWEYAARVLSANTNLGLPASWPANWSWSTYAGADTAGTTELLTRTPDATAGATGGLAIVGSLMGSSQVFPDNFEDLAIAPTTGTVSAISVAAGASSYTLTVTVGGSPLDGVNVWITSDSVGATTVASGYTNSVGTYTFYADPGTYFAWKQLAGYTFTNPETITVA